MNTGQTFAFASLLISLSACGGTSGGGDTPVGGTPATPVPRFVYSANADDDTVSIHSIDAATGQLRAAGYVRAGNAPQALARDRTGKFIYVVNALSDDISAFRVDAVRGWLTPVAGSPFRTGNNPQRLTIDVNNRFLFVSHVDDNNVSVFRIDPASGALAAVAGSPFAVTSPRGLTTDASGRFLYVAGGSAVSALRIDAETGALAPVLGSPFVAGDGGSAVGIDSSGRFWYVSNSLAESVSAFRIDADSGTLSPLPGSPFSAGTSPLRLALEPSGRFLFVGNSGSSDVSAFAIDADTGAPTAVAGSPFAMGPGNDFVFSLTADVPGFLYAGSAFSTLVAFRIDAASGTLTRERIAAGRGPSDLAVIAGTAAVRHAPKFTFAANAASADVAGYRVDAASGALTSITDIDAASAGAQATILTGQATADSIATEPTGRFAYVSGNIGLSAFGIDPASGALTPVVGSPFTALDSRAVATEPSGRFVFSASIDGTVSAFAIDPASGALAAVAGSPFTAGTSPSAIAVAPSGRFAYVANFGSNDISAFKIDSATGALTPVSGFPVATGGSSPRAIAVDADGRFAFVANEGSNNVAVFSISAANGFLTAVAGSPFFVGSGPRSVAVDPLGEFVFVGTDGSTGAAPALAAFAINRVTGVLTPVAGSPFALTSRPRAVATDPTGRFVYVTHPDSDSAAVFALDRDSGVLTAVDADTASGLQATIAAGDAPVAIDISNRLE